MEYMFSEDDDDRHKADIMNRKGNMLSDDGDYYGAIECYNQAINFDPEDDSGYYNRALTQMELGQAEAALSDMKFARACVDRRIERAKIGFSKGLLEEGGDKVEDIDEYVDRIKRRDLRLIVTGVGDILAKMHRYPEAVECYDWVLGNYPHHYHVYLDRGRCKLYLKDKEGALDDWRKANEVHMEQLKRPYEKALEMISILTENKIFLPRM